MQNSALPPSDLRRFATIVVPTRTGDNETDGAALSLLGSQLKERLKALGIGGRVTSAGGLVEVEDGDSVAAAEAAARFCGVSRTSVVRKVRPGLREASKALIEAGRALVYPKERFKVVVDVEPGLRVSPTDVEYEALGKLVDELGARGSRLSDRHPDRIIRARMAKSATYLGYVDYDGIGGLPVGLNGSAVALHSGGVGSYFASLEAMRAGLEVVLLYIYTRRTPPAHVRRAVSVATILREHHPTRRMELAAASFEEVAKIVKREFEPALVPIALHRCLARAASSLAAKRGAGWVSSGLTLDAGAANMAAYSAEVASKGFTGMFPVASKTDGELWARIADDRLKAKMTRLDWRLIPRRLGTAADAGGLARTWASGRAAAAVEEAMREAFSVDLGRGFIDYFGAMDSFASQLKV